MAYRRVHIWRRFYNGCNKTVREELPLIIKKYGIKSMLDIPCGDYNWMKVVEKGCDYIGCDIVGEIIAKNQERYSSDKVSFQILNMTKDTLPKPIYKFREKSKAEGVESDKDMYLYLLDSIPNIVL